MGGQLPVPVVKHAMEVGCMLGIERGGGQLSFPVVKHAHATDVECKINWIFLEEVAMNCYPHDEHPRHAPGPTPAVTLRDVANAAPSVARICTTALPGPHSMKRWRLQLHWTRKFV